MGKFLIYACLVFCSLASAADPVDSIIKAIQYQDLNYTTPNYRYQLQDNIVASMYITDYSNFLKANRNYEMEYRNIASGEDDDTYFVGLSSFGDNDNLISKMDFYFVVKCEEKECLLDSFTKNIRK